MPRAGASAAGGYYAGNAPMPHAADFDWRGGAFEPFSPHLRAVAVVHASPMPIGASAVARHHAPPLLRRARANAERPGRGQDSRIGFSGE